MLIDHIIQTRQFTTIAAHDDGGQRINFNFLLLSWKHILQSRPLTIWSNLFLFYSPLLSIKSIFCVFVTKVLLLFNSASRSSVVTNWLPIGEFSFLTPFNSTDFKFIFLCTRNNNKSGPYYYHWLLFAQQIDCDSDSHFKSSISTCGAKGNTRPEDIPGNMRLIWAPIVVVPGLDRSTPF